MHIEWAITCRYAEREGVGGTIIGAGTDVLVVPKIPGAVGSMLAVQLAASAEEMEPGHEHKLAVCVKDPQMELVKAPDGSVLPLLEATLASQAPVQQLVPGWLVNYFVPMAVQWWVAEPGTYSIEVRVNDGNPNICPVHVLLASDLS